VAGVGVGHDLNVVLGKKLREQLFARKGDPGEVLADICRGCAFLLADRRLHLASRDESRPEDGWDDDEWWDLVRDIDTSLEKRLRSFPEDWGAKLAHATLSRDIVAFHFLRIARKEKTRETPDEIAERVKRARKEVLEVIALGDCLPNDVRGIGPILLHNFTGYALSIAQGSDPEGDVMRLREAIGACLEMHEVPYARKEVSTAHALDFQLYLVLRSRDRTKELDEARRLAAQLVNEVGPHPPFHLSLAVAAFHLVVHDFAAAEKLAEQPSEPWRRGLLRAIVLTCDPQRHAEGERLLDGEVLAKLPQDRVARAAALAEAHDEVVFIGSFDLWKETGDIAAKLAAWR
jgi:hypothetical protein